MNAMPQKEYKKICNKRYTMVSFDLKGNRLGTRENYPMHEIMEYAILWTGNGYTVRIWDVDVADKFPPGTFLSNRIEDYPNK